MPHEVGELKPNLSFPEHEPEVAEQGRVYNNCSNSKFTENFIQSN